MSTQMQRTRKTFLVVAASNFALGGVSATLVCKFFPHWVLAFNVGNVVVFTMGLVWHVVTCRRRIDQIALPYIPKPRDGWDR